MMAAIFDMDGLLIDSEPLWRQAERHVFRTVGVILTDAMCHETQGLRSDEVVAYWYRRFPWGGKTCEQVRAELIDAVTRLVAAAGEPLPGVYEVLEALRAAGLKLGLASSSPPLLIESVVQKLGIERYFTATCSAVDQKRGKPDPAVYLEAARCLDTAPSECVAFEDSVPGVRSAKAAGMQVVAVPARSQFADPEFDIADWKLHSLADFSPALLRRSQRDPGA